MRVRTGDVVLANYHSRRFDRKQPMIFNREPAAILAVVQTVLALIIAFGLDLSSGQVGGVLAVSAAVLGLITRSQVTPNGQVRSRNRG